MIGGGSHAGWGCQCGIYGVTRLIRGDTVELPPQSQRCLLVASWPVVGVVLLWGRVIQHTHGYRAESARPRMLVVAPSQLHGRENRVLIEVLADPYALELVSDLDDLPRPRR